MDSTPPDVVPAEDEPSSQSTEKFPTISRTIHFVIPSEETIGNKEVYDRLREKITEAIDSEECPVMVDVVANKHYRFTGMFVRSCKLMFSRPKVFNSWTKYISAPVMVEFAAFAMGYQIAKTTPGCEALADLPLRQLPLSSQYGMMAIANTLGCEEVRDKLMELMRDSRAAGTGIVCPEKCMRLGLEVVL
jgi:hypothetical protein